MAKTHPFYEFLLEFIGEIELGQGFLSNNLFSGIGKRLVDNGANVLAVITSDGWFGKSLGPVEHFYLGMPRVGWWKAWNSTRGVA